MMKEFISYFVADSLSAFMIVENESFIKLLEFVFNLGQKMPHQNLDFKKSLPSRKQTKDFIIKEQQIKEKELLNKIKTTNPSHITTTCDIWTDKSKVNSFMDISVTLLENFKLQTYQYKLTYFPCAHTGENIENLFKDYATSIGTEPSKLRIISDSASNMLKGLRKFNNFRCAAHRMNTVVSEGNFDSIFIY